jgi:uncharacterized membrane protein YczE
LSLGDRCSYLSEGLGGGDPETGTTGPARNVLDEFEFVHGPSLLHHRTTAAPRRGAVHSTAMLPLPTYRFGRRLGQLLPGLVLFGIGIGLMVRADLGLSPWQVFHQGVADKVGIAMGTVTILTGIIVLLGWIPLRERWGLGTLLNVALIGNVLNWTLVALPDDLGQLSVRWSAMAGGIVLIGLGSGLYIGAGMGPGPRDGLMTGLARRGLRIGAVRTGLEISVLAIGWLLGGTVGIGTLAFALAIGPLIAVFLPGLTVQI